MSGICPIKQYVFLINNITTPFLLYVWNKDTIQVSDMFIGQSKFDNGSSLSTKTTCLVWPHLFCPNGSHCGQVLQY